MGEGSALFAERRPYPKLFLDYIGIGDSDKPKDYAYSTAATELRRSDCGTKVIHQYMSDNDLGNDGTRRPQPNLADFLD